MIHLITLCAAHTPPEVEYVCSSFVWSALWFVLGYLTCITAVIFLGGRK